MIRPLRVDRRLVFITIIDLESRHDPGPSRRTGIGEPAFAAESASTIAKSRRHGADNNAWRG
jgi:hypothetical protein